MNACVVRRGAGGTNVQAGDGFVAAAFRHRTSRAGDPHLHTHLLVANLTRGPDGHWSAPDARRFWALGNTASYLYEAVLRHELTVRLGVEFGPITHGIGDLAGIGRECIETFSQRRAQILERLDELGLDSARAAQYATLDTRDPKIAFDLAKGRLGRHRSRLRHHPRHAPSAHPPDQTRTPHRRDGRANDWRSRLRRRAHRERFDVRSSPRATRLV